jgi:hypothetical protein
MDKIFQRKILAGITQHFQHLQRVADLEIKPEYFDSASERNYFTMCMDFHTRYKTNFTDASFVAFLNNLIKEKKIKDADKSIYLQLYVELLDEDISDIEFFLQETTKFIKEQEVKNLLTKSATELLPQGKIYLK